MVAWKLVESSSTRRGAAQLRSSFAAGLLIALGRLVIVLTGKLMVSGALPEALRNQPYLLAANHIGVFDAAVLLAACHRWGISPRLVINSGLLDTPLVGRLLRRAGHVPIDPRTAGGLVRGTVLLPKPDSNRPVLIYPEGRPTRDPDLWPDRGQTGLARLALATGLPVLPVVQWGAHEVIPAATPPVRTLPGLFRLTVIWLRAVHPGHRVSFQVHLGEPVDLRGLRPGRPGDAIRAHTRIMMAITACLVPLRADEPGKPRHRDPTRPVGRPSPWRRAR